MGMSVKLGEGISRWGDLQLDAPRPVAASGEAIEVTQIHLHLIVPECILFKNARMRRKAVDTILGIVHFPGG
jgi:hypothetical protein